MSTSSCSSRPSPIITSSKSARENLSQHVDYVPPSLSSCPGDFLSRMGHQQLPRRGLACDRSLQPIECLDYRGTVAAIGVAGLRDLLSVGGTLRVTSGGDALPSRGFPRFIEWQARIDLHLEKPSPPSSGFRIDGRRRRPRSASAHHLLGCLDLKCAFARRNARWLARAPRDRA